MPYSDVTVLCLQGKHGLLLKGLIVDCIFHTEHEWSRAVQHPVQLV